MPARCARVACQACCFLREEMTLEKCRQGADLSQEDVSDVQAVGDLPWRNWRVQGLTLCSPKQ